VLRGWWDGVTKLSRIELQSDQAKQAENFRKTHSRDVGRYPRPAGQARRPAAQYAHPALPERFRQAPRIARETLEIYAPLAERIGIEKMQDELEDLAFAELFPDARSSIVARLSFLRSEGGDIVEKVLKELRKVLGRRRRQGGRRRPRENALFHLAKDAAQECGL